MGNSDSRHTAEVMSLVTPDRKSNGDLKVRPYSNEFIYNKAFAEAWLSFHDVVEYYVFGDEGSPSHGGIVFRPLPGALPGAPLGYLDICLCNGGGPCTTRLRPSRGWEPGAAAVIRSAGRLHLAYLIRLAHEFSSSFTFSNPGTNCNSWTRRFSVYVARRLATERAPARARTLVQLEVTATQCGLQLVTVTDALPAPFFSSCRRSGRRERMTAAALKGDTAGQASKENVDPQPPAAKRPRTAPASLRSVVNRAPATTSLQQSRPSRPRLQMRESASAAECGSTADFAALRIADTTEGGGRGSVSVVDLNTPPARTSMPSPPPATVVDRRTGEPWVARSAVDASETNVGLSSSESCDVMVPTSPVVSATVAARTRVARAAVTSTVCARRRNQHDKRLQQRQRQRRLAGLATLNGSFWELPAGKRRGHQPVLFSFAA